MRRSLQGAAWVVCVLLCACSETEPLTQIVVVVDSDWTAIDRFELDVDGLGDGASYDVRVDEVGFPRTLALVHDGGPLGPIAVTVRAYEDGNKTALLTERRQNIHFEQDRTRLLRIDLLAACATKHCDEACIDDDGATCVTAEEAAELTDWTGGVEPLGTSVTSPPDGGSDAGVERMDAGDAEVADSGPVDRDAASGADAGDAATMADASDAGDAGGEIEAGQDAAVDSDAGPCSTTCAFTAATPNAEAECVAGRCVADCDPGFVDCDGDYDNGCEVAVADSCGCPGLPAKRKPLTVDGTKVSGTLAAFPLLVSLADADVAAGAESDGADLCFTAADGVTRLAFELERYTSATGELIAWVAVPMLEAGVSTGLYLYYGDGTTTSRATPAAVWDADYAAVYHFDADARDSTANANAGTATGAVVGGSDMLGGMASFAAGTDEIDMGSGASLDNVFSGGGTLEAWIRPSSWGGGDLGRILDKATGDSPSAGWAFFLNNSTRTEAGAFAHGSSFGAIGWGSPSSAVALDGWHHIAVTWTKGLVATTPVIYIDGSSVAVTTSGTLFGTFDSDASASLRVGNSAAGDRGFDGLIDEARVSNTTRSAEWLATSYENQSAPATFLSVGAEEAYP